MCVLLSSNGTVPLSASVWVGQWDTTAKGHSEINRQGARAGTREAGEKKTLPCDFSPDSGQLVAWRLQGLFFEDVFSFLPKSDKSLSLVLLASWGLARLRLVRTLRATVLCFGRSQVVVVLRFHAMCWVAPYAACCYPRVEPKTKGDVTSAAWCCRCSRATTDTNTARHNLYNL